VDTDFTITGRLARFGRGGMIEDVSNRLLREFADCLRSHVEGPAPAAAAAGGGEAEASAPAAPPPAKPVKGLSLFFSVMWERIKRLFRRG
jgi:hypothetical protein